MRKGIIVLPGTKILTVITRCPYQRGFLMRKCTIVLPGTKTLAVITKWSQGGGSNIVVHNLGKNVG